MTSVTSLVHQHLTWEVPAIDSKKQASVYCGIWTDNLVICFDFGIQHESVHGLHLLLHGMRRARHFAIYIKRTDT